MSLARFGQRMWTGICKQYQASVAASLNEYGLKYDDIKIEQNSDLIQALNRLPQEERNMRARRMKRAFDISFKRKPMPEDLVKTFKPLQPYAADLEAIAKERRIERELLNAY